MPHRVANLFRSSTNSLESQLSGFKKGSHHNANGSSSNNKNKALQRQSSLPNNLRRQHSRSSERTSPYASSIEENPSEEAHPVAATAKPAMERHDSAEAPNHVRSGSHGHHHYHLHRLSFPGFGHIGRSSKDTHANATAVLDLQIESPPIVFYGDAESSSGALVSGQLFLNIKEDGLPLESFAATLNIHVTQKRPFVPHCQQCTHRYTELKTWNLIPAPLTLSKGLHPFPFSVLLGGHLPASMDSALMNIAYEFKAEAVPATGHGNPLKTERVLEVKRSLPTHETPHHSVRVFPPTNIKASVHFPQVIHPSGANTLTLRMDGIARPNERNGTVEYWKLKKLTWRLEETAKAVAPACEKHAPQKEAASVADAAAGLKKGVERSDMRVIGERTLFSGWKSNYDSLEDAAVEMELEYGVGKHFGTVEPEGSGGNSKERKRHACDGKSADGTEVSHQLMVEMIVSQECAPSGRPTLVSQTGVGRILRMHFGTVLTERGGIGISWDNEAPPIYQDVPPSPPGYGPEAEVARRRCHSAAAIVDAAAMLDADVDVQMLDGELPPAWTPSPALSRTASESDPAPPPSS